MSNVRKLELITRWLLVAALVLAVAAVLLGQTGTPARAASNTSAAHKTCNGPGPGGAALAGQTDTCSVFADMPYLTSPSNSQANQVTLTVTAPTGSTVASCTGVTSTYTTTGTKVGTTQCTFKVTAGTANTGDLLGTEVINIAGSAQPGDTVQQSAQAMNTTACTQIGQFPDSNAPTSGPGATVAAVAVAASPTPTPALPKTGEPTQRSPGASLTLAATLAIGALAALILALVATLRRRSAA